MPGGGRGPGGVGAMAESDWDTVTVLRKKGPSAAQAKSKQVSGGSGGARERGREGGGPGRGVVEAAAPSGAARATLTAHLRSFPRRSWRPSGAGRTWRPLRSVGIPRGGLGLIWGGCLQWGEEARDGTARLSQRSRTGPERAALGAAGMTPLELPLGFWLPRAELCLIFAEILEDLL